MAQEEIERIGGNEIKDRDIIINIPPRAMKSQIFSIMLNAWAWTKYPHLKFMSLSYSDTLSGQFAYKTKLVILSKWYQDRFKDSFKLADDDKSKTNYSNDKSGSRFSAGWTGSVTGSGADIIIADDPQKVSQTSQVALDNVNDVFRDSIYNRLNDPDVGIRIIIQQRCDEQDLSGYLLTNHSDYYNHINLPMEGGGEVKPAELIQEYSNNLLWAERFGENIISQYKQNVGTRGYQTQYLQQPSSKEGELIKKSWFKIIDFNELSDADRKLINNTVTDMFIDTAYTTNQKNDETAIIITTKFQNNVLIKKTLTFYLEFPELIKKIQELAVTYLGKNSSIFIEPKASGKSIVQQLRRISKLNVIETPSPKDSKEVRATAITPQLESGRVSLLKDNSNSAFFQQVTTFPFSNKDGIVDVLAYAVNRYVDNKQEMNYAML